MASDVSAPGGKELIIHHPEIVNGLQTSNEIYRFFRGNPALKDARSILVRVIVPEDEESRDKIIRATNSQTPIPKDMGKGDKVAKGKDLIVQIREAVKSVIRT